MDEATGRLREMSLQQTRLRERPSDVSLLFAEEGGKGSAASTDKSGRTPAGDVATAKE